MRDELLKGLTEEQIKKLDDCKNPEEILAIAKEEGFELNDEQLEAVSGGSCGQRVISDCPKCKSGRTISMETYEKNGETWHKCRCRSCNHTWTMKEK